MTHSDFQGKAPDNPAQPLWTKLPAAVRFPLDGEVLKAVVLWDGTLFKGRAPAHIPMVYHDGRLDLGDTVLDALAGRQTPPRRPNDRDHASRYPGRNARRCRQGVVVQRDT